MNDPRAAALQLCPFSDYLEVQLRARFEVIRWFELSEPERAAWLKQRAASVRAVITGGQFGISNELMQALPSLGMITINGVGVDKVDLQLARSRGVRVTTTPGTLTDDVADLAIGLIIGLLRNIPAADAYLRAGRWPKGEYPLARKVSGRRFGVVGLGAIGLAIAGRLAAFGPVAYTGPRQKPVPYEFHPDVVTLAKASDVLVLACPANASTRHLIDAAVLDALGADGYLINVARGAVVDETALIAALEEGRLAGAALDVFENEPHVPEALRASSKVVLTPHVASATVETRVQMADLILENLDALIHGTPPPTAVV
ncbi:MAG: 2-hydroxyacid dehydrogenase [Gammaproteobacteria bacterium]